MILLEMQIIASEIFGWNMHAIDVFNEHKSFRKLALLEERGRCRNNQIG